MDLVICHDISFLILTAFDILPNKRQNSHNVRQVFIRGQQKAKVPGIVMRTISLKLADTILIDYDIPGCVEYSNGHSFIRPSSPTKTGINKRRQGRSGDNKWLFVCVGGPIS